MSLEGTNSRANLQNSWPATVDPQPLRRLITPLPAEEFHALFSLKPFKKGL
jgi:hypothetical protein